jgi:hypothetical protein
MTKYKPSKLTIRPRPNAENYVTNGSNVEILLDGQPLPGLFAVHFDLNARETLKVSLEMYVQLDVEANVELQESDPSPVGKVPGESKIVTKYLLSSYSPVFADTEAVTPIEQK